MSITQEEKQLLMQEYKMSDNDTGSVPVQCAVLTKRISSLTEHLKKNHKDHSTRRGLLILVARRRKLLIYLRGKDVKAYDDLIAKLNIRPVH